MTEVLLSAHDLETIDRLLTIRADDRCHDLLPDAVLRRLTELFPSSVAGVSEVDRRSGVVVRSTTYPVRAQQSGDSLRATFPGTHPQHSVLVSVDRRDPGFNARDRLLFRLLTPSLHELVVALGHRREVPDLSPGEFRVLALVAQGASNSEVSATLSLSVATVRKHLEHIYGKLGVSNRTAAVARAFPQAAVQTASLSALSPAVGTSSP